MMGVLKEERDDVEMVANLSSLYIFILSWFSFNFNSITQKSTYRVLYLEKKSENRTGTSKCPHFPI